MSEQERQNLLRSMAATIAAGLVTQQAYVLPYDIHSLLYDQAVERTVNTALRIAEDLYDEVTSREGGESDA